MTSERFEGRVTRVEVDELHPVNADGLPAGGDSFEYRTATVEGFRGGQNHPVTIKLGSSEKRDWHRLGLGKRVSVDITYLDET